MSKTPDRRPGRLEEDEEIFLETNAVGPTQAGAFNYDGTSFKFRDSIGTFNPRQTIGTDNDFLLENEPPTPTNNYSNTQTGSKVTQEKWERGDTTKIKTIDYTYSGSRISQEVRKVYATDGSTILAQLTVVYSFTGAALTSATRTRDV